MYALRKITRSLDEYFRSESLLVPGEREREREGEREGGEREREREGGGGRGDGGRAPSSLN